MNKRNGFIRVWTFQDKSVVDTLLSGGIVRSELLWNSRVKIVDKQYIYSVDGIEYAPIYCFVKLGGAPALSLRLLVDCYDEFDRFYKLRLSSGNRIMVELDVPEEFILNTKEIEISDEDNYYVEYDNHFDYIMKTDENIEMVIKEIRPEWVVSIKQFSIINNSILCETIYHGSGISLFDSDVLFDNRCIITGDKILSRAESTDWVKEHSMHGVLYYHTINEALYCCDRETESLINEQIKCKKISNDKYNVVTVDELYDFRLSEGLNKSYSEVYV